jgi:hypothetical protein
MTDLTKSNAAPAYAGAPADIEPANVFDWLFSSPFEVESAFTPPAHRVAKVEDERLVFVDEASGKTSPSLTSYSTPMIRGRRYID